MNSFPQFDIFKPSYPPIINPKDLIKESTKRAPNAFLINVFSTSQEGRLPYVNDRYFHDGW